jgi:hypothetical protein
VKGNGQTSNVSLHSLPQVRNQALSCFGQQLGQRKRGDALNGRGEQNRKYDGFEELDMVLGYDTVEEEFCGVGERQPRDAVDHHQDETEGKQPLARTQQIPNERQNHSQVLARSGQTAGSGMGMHCFN